MSHYVTNPLRTSTVYTTYYVRAYNLRHTLNTYTHTHVYIRTRVSKRCVALARFYPIRQGDERQTIEELHQSIGQNANTCAFRGGVSTRFRVD